MTLPVILRRAAQADVDLARDWYEQQRVGLGGVFVEAVDQTVDQVAATPTLYAVALRDVRRAKLNRFPYVIYYRILVGRIEVIAVLHTRRQPGTWQGRI